MPRKLLKLALGATVLAAACSPRAEVSPVTTTTTSTTTTVSLSPTEAADEFDSCLGDQGLVVSEIPVDEDGRPDLSALAEMSDQNPEAWRAALSACAVVIVTNGALELSSNPELAEAVRSQLVAFSTCMRSQGVEAFPDPAEGFDGTTVPFPPEMIPIGDPELATAAEGCALSVGAGPTG